MPDVEPATDEQIAEIELLMGGATPPDQIKYVRYGHGGGRAFVDGDAGDRKLILDTYHVEDREFYYAVRGVLPGILARLDRAEVEGKRQANRANLLQCQMIEAEIKLDALQAATPLATNAPTQANSK